jgi:hypothetical protein
MKPTPRPIPRRVVARPPSAAVALLLCVTLTAIAPRRGYAQHAITDSTHVLTPTDWRRAWVGRWQVDFAYDSVRTSTAAGMRWRAATQRRVAGTLVITDTTAGRDASEQVAVLTIDFAQLLGHEISCRVIGRAPIRLGKQPGAVVIEFTPNVADCGFSGIVTRKGDVAKGQWSETTFAGPVTLGRLVLRKE